jgi:hypothetical protein
LDASFPNVVVDDLDVDAVVAYVEQHRDVSASVRAAELPYRAVLVEYQRQRDADSHERRLLALLKAGHQLGAHPVSYGTPMGLRSRQAVYERRTRLARKRAEAVDRAADEGRARGWLDEHRQQLLQLGSLLVDARHDLLLLVDGPARQELARCIDTAGALMTSRRPSQDFCTALAMAVHLLRPGTARTADDAALREHLELGRRLLW